MKITALLVILAAGAIIAVAGLAVASGTTASTLGMRNGTGSHNGMMGQDWSNGGFGGCPGMSSQYQNQTGPHYQCQNQYQQLNGTCSGQCSNPNDWNYSWNNDRGNCGMM